MGHIRLGRLPRTLRWQGVLQLLDGTPSDVPAVARATVSAAGARLRAVANDPSVGYCFWLLTRVTLAARSEDFVRALSHIELEVKGDDSTLSFISRLSDKAREESSRHPESGHFAELASLALRRALTESAGQHGG